MLVCGFEHVWRRTCVIWGTGMKAYEIHGAGGVDALVVSDRSEPDPGPGQVKVRIRASSINYRDLVTIEDPVARKLSLPHIPNSDGAGEVVALGSGVTRVKVGDRVMGSFFQRWHSGEITPDGMASALGGSLEGVLSEYTLLDEDGVVPVPKHLSYVEAATLPCAGLTAWHALVERGGVKAGDTVLLLGTGGVSIFGLQFCVLHGARAIITSSSDGKLSRAKDMGAWGTINYREHPDWYKQVNALTDNIGVDHVIEVGGAGTLERSIQSVRIGGNIYLIGILAQGQINPTALMRRSLHLHGIYVGSREMFENMNRGIEVAKLKPLVDRTFNFSDAQSAYHSMRANSHFGKLVITLDD